MKSVPGVIIFQFQAPLCFINSGVFRARLELECNIDKNTGREEPNGCIKELFQMVGCITMGVVLVKIRGLHRERIV